MKRSARARYCSKLSADTTHSITYTIYAQDNIARNIYICTRPAITIAYSIIDPLSRPLPPYTDTHVYIYERMRAMRRPEIIQPRDGRLPVRARLFHPLEDSSDVN